MDKLVTANKIRKFIKRLYSSGETEASIVNKLNVVRKFIFWAYKISQINKNDFKQSTDVIDNYLEHAKLTSEAKNDNSNLHPAPKPILTNFNEFQRISTNFGIRHYIAFVLIFLFIAILGSGIYNRFFIKQTSTLAYPTSPNVRGGRMLSFQGRLTDNIGNPITAATSVVFQLYTASTGGSSIYTTGTCSITPDQDGIFNVMIGGSGYSPTPPQDVCGTEITSDIFSEHPNIYLGVTVGTDSEMTPRQQIANVGYAINAETLQGYPPGTTTNAIPYINNAGDLLMAAPSTAIRSLNTSATFTISSAKATTIQAASTGDIVLQATESGALRFRTGGNSDTYTRLFIDTSSNNGNVGIGTTTPGTLLDVAGTGRFSSTLTDTYANSGALTLSGNGAGITFSGTGPNQIITASGVNLALMPNAANVGIGTTTPAYKLDVAGFATVSGNLMAGGQVQLGRFAASPTAISGGSMYYDTVNNKAYFYNGSSWTDMTGGSGSAINYWNLSAANGTISPMNTTVDLLIGSTASSSAKFGFLNVTGAGTPTASISATTGSTYLTGTGTLSTTNMLPVTIGSSTTGPITLSPKGTTGSYVDGVGNMGVGTTGPSSKLEVNGNITLTSGGGQKITTPGTNLSLEQTGDTYGTTRLNIQSRNGSAGALFESVGLDLVDFGFKGNTGYQSNLRYEHRSSEIHGGSDTSVGEFQLIDDPTGTATFYFTANKNATVVRSGSFGVGYDNPGTAKLAVNGNVGIGTTSPAYKLDVSGFATISGNLMAGGQVQLGRFAAAPTALGNGGMYYDSVTNKAYYYNGSGWVDMTGGGTNYWNLSTTNGTISPMNTTVDLLVGSTATSSAKFAFMNVNSGTPTASISATTGSTYLTGTGTLSTTNMLPVIIGSSTTGPISLSPKGTTGLYVDGVGNVGIGTTAPATNLEVSGASGNTQFTGNNIQFTRNAANYIYATNASGDLRFGAGGRTQDMMISTGGNVGIGTTSPSYTLDVNGTIRGDYYLDSSNINYGLDPAGTSNFGGYSLKVTGGALLAVDSGNVGIGTTAPEAKLDISGNATISGNLTFYGGARTIANRSMNTLTIGDSQTGNVTLSSGALTRIQAGGTTSGNGNNASIYFLDSSGNTMGRVETIGQVALGTGADGAITVTATKNLNTDTIAAGRSYADGIAYRVNATTSGGSSMTRYSGSDTLSNGIAANDEVLVIDLQGTTDDTTAVGNYEFKIVQSITASTITFTSPLVNDYAGYTAANQRVVVQRVPQYTSVTLSSSGSLTASAWDLLTTTPTGAAGYYTGAAVFRATGTVSIGSGTSITTAGKGFQGGAGGAAPNQHGGYNGYGTDKTTSTEGGSANIGGGAGGAGGYYQGGGGGSYFTYGTSGTGGASRGTKYGVANLSKMYLGSGGGGGASYADGTGSGNGGAGGASGGIVFVSASTITVTGTVSANGSNGSNGVTHGFGGGGGSGGSVYLAGNTVTAGSSLVSARGGTGGTGYIGYNGGDGGTGINVIVSTSSTGTTNPAATYITNYGTLYIGSTNTTSADLAEYYVSGDKSIEPGDVISISDTKLLDNNEREIVNQGVLRKTSVPYDSKIIGIISTNPGLLMNSIDGETGAADKRALALSGRVPVKIAPDSPAIAIGDFLTSSATYPGMAMKATKAGYTVAKALENWQPGGPATIEVFVNLGYYDPTLMLASTGELQITSSPSAGFVYDGNLNTEDQISKINGFDSRSPLILSEVERINDQIFKLQDAAGNTIDRIGAFGELISAKITSGLIETENAIVKNILVAKNIVAKKLIVEEKIISPVVETENIVASGEARLNTIATNTIQPQTNDLTIDLSQSNSSNLTNSSNSTSNKGDLARLIIRGLAGKTAAVIDAEGNATFSGTLAAKDATISGTLAAGEASISGTLVAENIQAGNINQLESSVASQSSSLQNLSSDINDVQALLAQIKNTPLTNPYDQTNLSNITDLSLQTLTVSGNSNFYNVSVTGSLFTGTTMFDNNSIISLASDLKLSSLGTITLFNNAVVIAKDGTITTKGEIIAQKGVVTDTIKPLKEDNLSILGNLSVLGNLSLPKATDSAVIAATENFSQNGIFAPAIETASTSAGVGILPENSSEVIIYNNNVKENSLVYLTPSSSTPQTTPLTVVKKFTGNKPYFKVATNTPTPIPIKFDWLIIN